MSINASFTLPLLVSRTQVLSNTVRPRARPRAPRAAARPARPDCAPQLPELGRLAAARSADKVHSLDVLSKHYSTQNRAFVRTCFVTEVTVYVLSLSLRTPRALCTRHPPSLTPTHETASATF